MPTPCSAERSQSPLAPAPLTAELAIAHGLADKSNLREQRVFTLSPTGAQFRGEMTFEQWEQGLAMIRMAESSLKIWLADFISRGTELFGEARVQESLAQLEFPQMDVNQALGIASLPLFCRHASLTSEHLWVLAKAELKPAELERWKNLAVQHKLSAIRLQRSIAAGRVIEEPAGGSRTGGLPTIHGMRQLFDTWHRQVEKSDPIEAWSLEKKRELWEELEEPTKLGVQLAKELGKMEELIGESEVEG